MYSIALAGPLTIPCVTVVGLMIGGEMNILGFLIKRYFGERSFGALYGLIFAVFATGGALGPQLLAMSRSHLNTYAPGLAAIAVACLLVGLPFFWLGPYQYPSPSKPS
jgi:cyanate permease